MVIPDIEELDGIEKVSLVPGEKLEVDRKNGHVVIITLRGVGTAKNKMRPDSFGLILNGDHGATKLEFRFGDIFIIENTITPDENVALEFIIVRLSYKK